jgi:glycosyltransferase involved in cell wall biosynthesis
MPTLPVITVVTPSFNQARFIERTIKSVLGQGYPALEYIVVDGGSTDGSVSIIRKYASALKWWCTEPDEGQADAIAKGFARTTGDVLCWLNSDDVLLPGALRAISRFFAENPAAEVVNGAAYYIDEDDRPLRGLSQCTYTRGVRASARRFRFYGQDGVYQMATFWRRSAYASVGGLRNLKFAMDLDLFVRLSARQRFHVIPKYLACFRSHGASKSKTMEDVRRSEVEMIRRDYGVRESHLVTRAAFYGWFRAMSLCRKSLLQTRVLFGMERFPDPGANAPVPGDTYEQH